MGERGRGHIYLQRGAWYLQFYQTENRDGVLVKVRKSVFLHDKDREHNSASCLRPSYCQIDCRVFHGSYRSFRNHLLDPDVREAPFWIFQSDRHIPIPDTSPDGIHWDAYQRLHSDKMAERHWQSAIPLLSAGLMFGLLTAFRHEVPLAIAFLLLGSGFLYACYPAFWATYEALFVSVNPHQILTGHIQSSSLLCSLGALQPADR
jgi:hypothetical protein